MNNSEKFYTELSREISYALRHAPWEYELELDIEGWVLLEQLINSLHKSLLWKNVNASDIKKMIDLSEKKRHEIKKGKIRACYGHSIPVRIQKEALELPRVLYHGTSLDYLNSIRANGLLPMNRQYVHLSEDIETATLVGKRKSNVPVILSIDTLKAKLKGISFYFGNERVWLVDNIPSDCISIVKI